MMLNQIPLANHDTELHNGLHNIYTLVMDKGNQILSEQKSHDMMSARKTWQLANHRQIHVLHYSKKLKEHDQHHLWYVDTLRSSC